MNEDGQKGELRRSLRARRRALSKEEQERATQAVYARIRALAPYRAAHSIMAYMACRGELSLAPVLEDIWARGKALLLPRCEASDIMTARQVDSPSQLAPGAYGVMEPSEACEVVSPQEIDLILVPGVAFDRRGGRLGQGGGYYDRFLAETPALRVGICHDFALLERVPTQAHDRFMDCIITPGACCFGGSREGTQE